ncbi:hypothetical protein, partial [Rhodospirillum rubrum]
PSLSVARGLVLGLVVILGGCGEVPRPFARDADGLAAPNPLSALSSGTGVTVEPAAGVAAPWDRLVALETAEMLRDQGIPAEIGGGDSLGHHLSLRLRAAPGAATDQGRLEIETVWRLTTDDGTVLAGDIDRVSVDAGEWRTAAPEAARRVGGPVVGRVNRALSTGGWAALEQEAAGGEPPPNAAPLAATSQAASPAEPPPPARPAKALPPKPVLPDSPLAKQVVSPEAAKVTALAPRITAAPGDGVKALTEAMTTLIQAAGVSLTANPKAATFGILGRVSATPAAAGKEKIELVWEVTDPRSGAVVGTVRQQNVVPKGALDGVWGRLAYDIARGALEGIGDVLQNPRKP